MKYLLLILLSSFVNISFACLNESNVSKYGKSSSYEFSIRDLYFSEFHDKAFIENKLNELIAAKPVTDKEILENQNDIAVNFIKLGKLTEAEKILSLLLKKYPNNYSVVVNLGTLYELQGKNQLALNYINKAVILNPDSHNKSEWFHIKILEFKLKNLPQDEIAASNILDLTSIKKDAYEIASEVGYQLYERIPFTPAPNALMAKVLLEYGNFLADSVSIKAAYLIYGAGDHYDAQHILKFAEKREELKKYFKKYKEELPDDEIFSSEKGIKKNIAISSSLLEKGMDYFNKEEEKKREKENQYFIAGGIGLCSLILGAFLYKRKKQPVPEI